MLLHINCITDEHSHLIRRQRSNRYKSDTSMDVINDKLLSIMKSFDEAKFSNFVKCLRQTSQKMMARIFENGGGVIKVQVQSGVVKCRDIQQLHQNIEDFQNRTAPWSYQTDKLITELREEDIQILNSQMDKHTVIIWMWCRSQEAVENLREMYESNKLREVLFGFANISSSSPEIIEQTGINIDSNQFKKTVAVSTMSISVIERIGDEYATGIIKLRNEIYVICRSEVNEHRVIRVFEDRNPFRRKRIIEIQEMAHPVDIGSSEKDNCLYVCDHDEQCIWKITKQADDEYKITKWLTLDYKERTLSVSRNGHLLFINDANLMVYGSDAKLFRSILLPDDIDIHRHAVETSIGNFVIIHYMGKEKRGWPMLKGSGRVISELTSDGQMVVRRFISSDEEKILSDPQHLSLDSDDQVILVQSYNGRAILLDSDLKWSPICCSPEAEENKERLGRGPMRVFYDEENKQLIIGGDTVRGINVYSFSRKFKNI